MVGSKLKKCVIAGMCGLAAAGILAGCGNSSSDSGKMKVGVVQIVQHPALDAANKGFLNALNEAGLKDKIEIDQQNAEKRQRDEEQPFDDVIAHYSFSFIHQV